MNILKPNAAGRKCAPKVQDHPILIRAQVIRIICAVFVASQNFHAIHESKSILENDRYARKTKTTLNIINKDKEFLAINKANKNSNLPFANNRL